MQHNFLDKLGYTTHNGLVHHLDEAKNNVERLYIDEVQQSLIVPANAVFFRRFYKSDEDETPVFSIPSVCIFDRGDSFFNSEKHKTLHAELWSAGKIEIYIILGETRVDIINARKPAKQVEKEVSLDHKDLCLVSQAVQEFEYTKFSAHLFSSGTFWGQSEFQQKIDGNSAPYDFLLNYLMAARKQLLNDSSIGLEVKTIDTLLITSILIKFLEDIKDDDGRHTLKEIYKKHNLTEETFEEGLKKGKCVNILEDLAGVFNGQIFNTFSEDEKTAISKANLIPIAKFLSADIDQNTNQGFLWKQYSFKHLPAEVISAIYENFIQAEADRNAEVRKDVVYTPLHLVNLMIDESMPLDQPELFENKQFKVLDPACGSGVFLVAAYKRMLQWWAINQWRETNAIAYPDKETAKEILENNIFGVDIEKVAALVSIFGLTTAFLDKLTPKEIWNDLKFKDLSKHNIQGLNFIDWVKKDNNKDKRFDLVIGNPPFNASKKGTITDKDLKEVFGKKVPGNKLALKFLEAALYFGKKVCMIIPSNVFLYNKSDPSNEYRKDIFTQYTVEKIYDFTHLRETLFIKKNIRSIQGPKKKTGRTPVLALIIRREPSEYQPIQHIIVKRETLSEQKLLFEIDYYDRHRIRWDWAIDGQKQFIWKTNLLGGGRLFHLVYRLSLLETLEDYILDKVKSNKEWMFEVGYETGNPENPVLIPYLYQQDKVCGIGKNGKVKSSEIETNKYFYRPKVSSLFNPPFVIISKKIGGSYLPVGYVKDYEKEYLVFNSSYLGIRAPASQIVDLEKIYEYLKTNEDFCRFWVLIQSPSTMINQETSFKKQDLETLPFNTKYISLNKNEEAIKNDVLRFYIHLGKAINEGTDGKVLHDSITPLELEEFGTTFSNVLNEIYAENGKSWQPGKVIQTPTLIIYQLGFGTDGGLKCDFQVDTKNTIHSLIDNIKSNTGIRFKRIIRLYQHLDGYDCVFLIKPKDRRYWLQSIALRDADDTFMDLKKAGY
jgi:type I restriction-modification system DNA methylase subunit